MAAVERLLQLREEEVERGGEGRAASDRPPLSISVVSPSPLLHFASDVQRRSAARLTFDVESRPSAALLSDLSRSYGGHAQLSFVQGSVHSVDPRDSTVQWREVTPRSDGGGEGSGGGAGGVLPFDRLLLAVGSRPSQPWSGERVRVVRDAASIAALRLRLQRLMDDDEGGVLLVVGNGGLALECVQLLSSPGLALRLPRVVWVLKDDWLGNTFLDPTSSAFLLPLLFPAEDPAMESRSYEEDEGQRMKTGRTEWERRTAEREGDVDSPPVSSPAYGGASGPNWQRQLSWEEGQGSVQPPSAEARALANGSAPIPPLIHFNAVVSQCHEEVEQAASQSSASSPSQDGVSAATARRPPLLRVRLSNGLDYSAALLISCTGVVPNTDCLSSSCIALHPQDGGVMVGPSLRTSLPRIYAAGDCASLSIPSHSTFLQMRLWSQAFVQGGNAASAMWDDAHNMGVSEERWREQAEGDDSDVYYPPFVHETCVMGERLLLMGLFNERQLEWKRQERRQWREARRRKRAEMTSSDAREEEKEEEEGDDLAGECRVSMRVVPHSTGNGGERRGQYVKVLQSGGRVVGCTLIGETELEEVMENLITNQLNISWLGDDWLHADVDLQDFFD